MIWCIKHLSMLSSWRTVILQLDLALPLLSLCLRYFQFIYCSCQFDDFKISLNSFNDCFDPITSSACTAEQEALAPPFQPWAWTFSQTECIERPENTQFKSFRSWESVNKPRPLSKVVPHSPRALCEDRWFYVRWHSRWPRCNRPPGWRTGQTWTPIARYANKWTNQQKNNNLCILSDQQHCTIAHIM